MTVLVVAVLCLIVVAAACMVAGVFVLFGLGPALIAAGIIMAAVAALLSRGLRINGQ